MAEVKKSVAGLKQAEITIIEEQLSMSFGVFTIDIAATLSNRFDGIVHEMKVVGSQYAYIETTIPGKTNEVQEQRRKKIADINSKGKELKEKRHVAINQWHKKVVAYIVATYGQPVIENGVTVAYGDRIEVMKNKRLKKFW